MFGDDDDVADVLDDGDLADVGRVALGGGGGLRAASRRRRVHPEAVQHAPLRVRIELRPRLREGRPPAVRCLGRRSSASAGRGRAGFVAVGVGAEAAGSAVAWRMESLPPHANEHQQQTEGQQLNRNRRMWRAGMQRMYQKLSLRAPGNSARSAPCATVRRHPDASAPRRQGRRPRRRSLSAVNGSPSDDGGNGHRDERHDVRVHRRCGRRRLRWTAVYQIM